MASSSAAARTDYTALLVKANKRFSHRVQTQISYALQSQHGINGIYNNDNWFQYWGPQASHSILNVSGTIDLPWKFQFSFISSYTSRGPFQPVIPGTDLTGSGISGFPLPGMGGSLFNFGLGAGDLANLINQYNQTYAGKAGHPILLRHSRTLRFPPAPTSSATTSIRRTSA